VIVDEREVRVIAEAGQVGGSVDYAVRAAEAAKAAGCYGFKIQVLDPERIAAADSPKYWATQAGDDSSQRQVFTRNGVLDAGAVREVFAECRRIGLVPLATPFDGDAVATLVDAGSTVIKIASGDLTYRRLLSAVAETGLPVLLSTGACQGHEVQRSYGWLRDHGCPLVIPLACPLIYPTPDDEAHLLRISYLRSVYGPRVGYSDHTLGVETGMVAAALGALILEKHFCAEETGAPDDEMALTPLMMEAYVRGAEAGKRMAGVHGLAPVEAEQPARVGARRSVRWARDLDAGHVITADDIVEQRPFVSGGLSAWFADHAIGGRVATAVKAGDVVTDAGQWAPTQTGPSQVEAVFSGRR
jgi:N,N'-diacetyllegionaminate synthase